MLEIGCATGGLFEILVRKYGHVDYTGLDVSAPDIREARPRYPGAT